jgi:hypothetical protein
MKKELCEQSDIASQGYQQGAAMGAELNGPQQTMRIAVSAQKDPGTATQPGTDLQRVQMQETQTTAPRSTSKPARPGEKAQLPCAKSGRIRNSTRANGLFIMHVW